MNTRQTMLYAAMNSAIHEISRKVPHVFSIDIGMLRRWVEKNDPLAKQIEDGTLTLDVNRCRLYQMYIFCIFHSPNNAHETIGLPYESFFQIMTNTFEPRGVIPFRFIRMQQRGADIHDCTHRLLFMDWSFLHDDITKCITEDQLFKACTDEAYCLSMSDFVNACEARLLAHSSHDAQRVKMNLQFIRESLQRVYDGQSTHTMELEFFQNMN